MIVPLDLLLFLILLITAVLALQVTNLVTAVLLLSAYSLFAAMLFAGMGAVDVALVEAALGAGLTGVLFLAAVIVTTSSVGETHGPSRRLLVLPVVGLFLGLMLFASGGLPDRGDPQAPTRDGVAAYYLRNALEDMQTPNVVTALLTDYRSLDTLGEAVVILTAALATALLMARRPDRPDTPSQQRIWSEDEPEQLAPPDAAADAASRHAPSRHGGSGHRASGHRASGHGGAQDGGVLGESDREGDT